MTLRHPQHHPSDETLLRFVSGSLPAAAALVVSVHRDGCPICRETIGHFEATGGALLDAVEPAALSDSALDDVLARLDEVEPAPSLQPAQAYREPFAPGLPLPSALRHCEIGNWQRVTPSLRIRRIRVPDAPEERLLLMHIGAGRRMPEHGHTGTEFTHVLSGRFYDHLGRYGPGDLEEADADIEHQPIVEPDEDCYCLAAVDGRMRLKSRIGRMVQPLFGF